MPISRYNKIMPVNNIDEGYKKLYYYSRGITGTGLRQYPSLNLQYPTTEQISGYTIQTETWGLGQRFYKLAAKYYGDPQYWWVIAFFNKAPTEQHIEIGQIVEIPIPLGNVLSDMGL